MFLHPISFVFGILALISFVLSPFILVALLLLNVG